MHSSIMRCFVSNFVFTNIFTCDVHFNVNWSSHGEPNPLGTRVSSNRRDSLELYLAKNGLVKEKFIMMMLDQLNEMRLPSRFLTQRHQPCEKPLLLYVKRIIFSG